MSAIIREYLIDYYEEIMPPGSIIKKPQLKITRITVALIDIDNAIKKILPEYTNKEWEAVTLFIQCNPARGQDLKDIGEETGIYSADKLFHKICRKIAREAGQQYLDKYLLNIILCELKTIEGKETGKVKRRKLEKEEVKFIFEKFSMTKEMREGNYAHVNIFNFAYDVFQNLGAGCKVCHKIVKRYDSCPHFKLIKREGDYDRLEQIR